MTDTGTTTRLRRVHAGLYETVDGRYIVASVTREEDDGYGPAGEVQWYVRPANGDAHDLHATKRDAVEALKELLANNS